MLLNSILNSLQKITRPVYNSSFVLQNIDWLIGLNIFFLIFVSTYAPSDNIGYFAIFVILLTVVKLITTLKTKAFCLRYVTKIFEKIFSGKFYLNICAVEKYF